MSEENECRVCGRPEPCHKEGKGEQDHTFVLTICHLCQKPCDLPSLASAKRHDYIGKVYHPECGHTHYWGRDYDSSPECVACGTDQITYLKSTLKQHGVLFDDEDACGPEMYDPTQVK